MTYLQQNQAPRIIIINIVTLIVAVMAVTLRLISRRLSAAHFWWDDGLIIVGLFLDFGSSAFNFTAARNGAGRHQEVVPASQLVTLAQVIYGIEILYGPLLTAIKSSILLFYLRLFGIRKAFRISIYVLETLVICWCISIFFTSIFQSSPPSYLWKPDLPNAHHINFTRYLVGLAIPNVLMDFAILVLPLSIVWQLQISKRRKMALSAIFLVGTFVCTVSIVRAHAVAVVDNSDKSFSYASTLIWSAVEANVGITCACLPIMQPVVQKVAGKLMDGGASDPGKNVRRALEGRDSSPDTFESSTRPLRRLDQDVISIPNRVVPANSTWVSAGEGFASYGYQEDNDESSGIPMNAIHVKNVVDLKSGNQA